MTTYWYVDTRISPSDESDAFDGGAGVGKLRDSFADVTQAADTYISLARGATFGPLTLTTNGSAKNFILDAYGTGDLPKIVATGAYGINANGFGSHIYRNLEVVGGSTAAIGGMASNVEVNGCTIHDAEKGVFYPTATAIRTGRQVIGCHIYNCTSGAIRDDHSAGTNIVHTNILVTGNTIHDCGPGVYFYAAKDGNAYNGLQVFFNNIYNCLGAGVYIRTIAVTYPTLPTAFLKNVIVAYNNIFECTQCGVYLRGTDTASFVRKNTIYRCGTGTNTATDTLGGVWTGECSGLAIEYNEIHDIYTPDIDGCGIFDDQHNSGVVIHGNKIYNCHGLAGVTLSGVGIISYRSTNTIIRSNLVYANKNGIAVAGEAAYTSGHRIYNNTVVANDLWGMYIGRGVASPECTDVEVQNNCITGNAANDPGGNAEDIQVSADATSITVDYNCYGTSDINAPSSAGANNISVDPQLTADYFKKDTSPLLGAGVHIKYCRDINGRQRPNPPSIGADDVAKLVAA